MRVGKPFSIKDIENAGDTFIPLRTKCRTCGKPFRLIAIDVFATQALLGRRLECSTCFDWTATMEALGAESLSPEVSVRRVTLEVELIR